MAMASPACLARMHPLHGCHNMVDDAGSVSATSDHLRMPNVRCMYRREGSYSSVRRCFVLSTVSSTAFMFLINRNQALADVRITLSNMQATEVPCPEGQTTVTGGTSFGATCFRVTGDAMNPAKQSVYNADIFGRVYDAQGEPALDAVENLRIDTIPEIPPGKSKVSFQITVNAAQAKLGPLELKNFKATGFLGKVNNKQGTGRLDDIDFSELDGPDENP